MKSITRATCREAPPNPFNRHLKVLGESVVVINKEVRTGNKYLTTHNMQPEGNCRDPEGANLVDIDSTPQKLTEKLRQLSMALATAEARERRALAQGLHDDLGQRLAVIGLKIAGIERCDLPKSIKGAVDECAAAIDQANRTSRTMAMDLGSPMWDKRLGFTAAMACLACEVRRIYKLEVGSDGDGKPVPMDPALSIPLFRAVREVLVRAAQQAGVQKVTLFHGCSEANHMVVTVTVFGTSIDRATVMPSDASRGIGNISMRERLHLLGGSLSVHSKPGQGTTVTLVLPLLREQESSAMLDWA